MQFTLLEIAAPFSGRVLSFSTTRVALHHSLGSGDTRCRDKGHRGASEIRWDPAQPATLRWPLATRSRAGSRTGTDQGGEFCGIFGAPVLKRSQVAIRLGLQIGPTLELAKGLGPLVVNRSRSGALLEGSNAGPTGPKLLGVFAVSRAAQSAGSVLASFLTKRERITSGMVGKQIWLLPIPRGSALNSEQARTDVGLYVSACVHAIDVSRWDARLKAEAYSEAYPLKTLGTSLVFTLHDLFTSGRRGLPHQISGPNVKVSQNTHTHTHTYAHTHTGPAKKDININNFTDGCQPQD